MVDFKRASEAKKMFIKCDGYVGFGPCENEAIYYFNKKETDEDGVEGDYVFCEKCIKILDPQISEQELEDAKIAMFGYKYRKLK